MRTIIKCVLICFCLTFSSIALSETPEKLTQLYYQYLKNSEWKKVTEMMHEDAIDELKNSLLPIFEQEASQKRNMFLERIYGKGTTLHDAKKSSSKDFFQRSLKNIAGMMRNAQFKVDNIKVLGKVMEDNDKTHVLIRETLMADDYKMQTIEVFTFKKYKDGWKMALSGKLANFVQTARLTTVRSKNKKNNK